MEEIKSMKSIYNIFSSFFNYSVLQYNIRLLINDRDLFRMKIRKNISELKICTFQIISRKDFHIKNGFKENTIIYNIQEISFWHSSHCF